MPDMILTGVEKEAERNELNPRKKDPYPPYLIQGGLRAAAIGADFLDLTNRQVGPQTVQTAISTSSTDGTFITNITTVNDVLTAQVFGV